MEIHFKNGSYIKVLPSDETKRSSRSVIQHRLYNSDGTVDYIFCKEIIDEVLRPFCCIESKDENED